MTQMSRDLGMTILGGAHCLSAFENATFLKELLNKSLKLGGAHAPVPADVGISKLIILIIF